ncbi:T9SS type A sorting domain-containing protein [Flavobacterium sp.]|uniref:T9SS type A sorting domain-containing protein n=1 Tax=Flavobacterium sp. TaxID=239 RepID=UPI00262E0335|nr:T9SS type A sorting domain-containing protein [Flavobacterium sp.]
MQELKSWVDRKALAFRQTNVVNWEFVGPANVGGRITDIEVPVNNPSTYIIGTATGGIFRTVDAGNSWEAIFDAQSTLSIGDLDISKTNNNLILVGTGEPNGGGGSTSMDGNGVYISTDGGDTWESKGLNNVGSIAKVIIDPTNANNMYVGAMGLLYAQTNNRGIYKSTNGGETWNNTLFVSDKTGVIDMAINPLNPNILYAATWERTRTPENRVYGGATSNIYKSTDAGLTWTLLTNVLPNTTDKGRISIDISNSNPDILIATYTNILGTTLAIKKTINGGTTWTTLPSGSITASPYNWWFGGVFINPTNSNNVFMSEFDTHYSNNGGTSWALTSGTTEAIHVDQHVVAFTSNNEVLLGNDGGLYRSTNGTSYTKINNLPISQAYRMAVNPNNANHVYAGFQDNGTWRTLTGESNNWNQIYGGDGMQPNVNPMNTNILFAEYQYGAFVRSVDDGGSFGFSDNGVSTTEPRNWDTPYVFDPANPNIMYFGTSNLYKSTDNGINWTSISGNLSKGVYTGTQRYGTITTIDVSPLNSNIIFIGTDDGNVWKTTDGGSTYTKISGFLPNKWVTKVKASPTNANQVYVTYSGYRYNLFDSNLYVSNDLGNSWQDLSSDLPNSPLSDIEITSENILFVASDIGVLVSNDLGVHWNFVGTNMPSVVVTDLILHANSNFLFAATFGRGVYKIDLTALALSTTTNPINFNSITVYPNPASEFIYVDLQFNQVSEFNAKFLDMNGKLVQSYRIDQESAGRHLIKMDVSAFPKGIYFLKLNDSNKTIKVAVQ